MICSLSWWNPGSGLEVNSLANSPCTGLRRQPSSHQAEAVAALDLSRWSQAEASGSVFFLRW